jgi:signal transduction histidine kinase
MHSISVSTEAENLPSICCDASQIQQVLTAIIMNAVDAISSQGPRGGNLRIRAAMVDPAWVDIAVANDGPPIPKDVLPHIFEPFFSTKQAASGVGLGLAVTYGIVKRHGGDIQVTTGERTTFHVILPVGATPPESQNTEEADVGRDTVHTDR